MEDWEFNICSKEFKKLKKDRIGKLFFKELENVLFAIFKKGYVLGKEVALKQSKEKQK